jgi:hypothetical protein
VASLGELLAGAGGLGLGLDLARLHGRGQEADGDNLASLQLGDGAGSVTSAREALGPLAILVANEGLLRVREREREREREEMEENI